MSELQPDASAGRVPRTVDAVVVGAGFAGLYMLHQLRGLGLDVVVLEAGDDIGGTWYWNRYPGARCDVESVDYSYSFSEELQQEWQWTERFPAQPEVLRYINYVADKFDLRRDIELNTRATQASFDERRNEWHVRAESGAVFRARFCIMATGCLSSPKEPEFEGLETFKGEVYRSSNWPHHEVDFAGRRVGVIGTGSTGIQIIPIVAEQAEHLTVFQRTPSFSVPARNAPLDSEFLRWLKLNYPERRRMARESPSGMVLEANDARAVDVSPEEREAEYEARWRIGGPGFLRSFNDLLFSAEANDTAADFIHRKIDELVKDPADADKLKPRGYPVGARRVCLDTDYYITYNRDNVTLVDCTESPIVQVTPTGVCTKDVEHPLDALILATGFDAMTGALARIDIRGLKGQKLADKWVDGPRTYLGVAVASFPNLFLITGPGSPSVLSNMITSIEQHVEWITGCLDYMQRNELVRVEASHVAEDEWVAHVNDVASRTLYPLAKSWYTGANVPGKPRVFMPYVGGVGTYARICGDVAQAGYTGFQFWPPFRTPELALGHELDDVSPVVARQ